MPLENPLSLLAEQARTALSTEPSLKGCTLKLTSHARRRHMGLSISDAGRVVTVRTPPGTSSEQVVAFVIHQRPWITANRARISENVAAIPRKELVTGEGFDFIGAPMRLKVTDIPGSVARARLGSGWWLTANSAELSQRGAAPLIDWYADAGATWLHEHAPELWQRIAPQAAMPTLAIERSTRRWGSYHHARHEVRLAWRAFQLPRPLLHYALVHELVHAARPGGRPHGPEFWTLLQRHLPTARRDHGLIRKAGPQVWEGAIRPAP
ncbi:YgjP-like metallopeptidase domain-containing protein [Streptomyces erythrochromogenes]|uniref:M48 family metallopeptidase n=1 Tax=Streptomyces erythrochromogenes TaxID=285574 RepID=UPI00341E5002